MATLPEIELSPFLFLNKSTIIFGKSATGKTTILLDILYLLRPYVDQIIIFSNTDKQTHVYSCGIVPSVLIHETVSAEILKDIYERQEALAETYRRVWRPHIIESLFNRIHNSNKDTVLNTIGQIRTVIAELKLSTADDKDLRCEECERYISLIYRAIINDNAAALSKEKLSPDEQYTLKYININPNLILLFDDMTSDIQSIKSAPILRDWYNQGRHVFTTVLMGLHDDSCVLPAHRSGSFINIFTTSVAVNTMLARSNTGLNKDEKKKFELAAKLAFTDMLPWQKLLYHRDQNKFYRFTASKRGYFEFCSPTIRKFCNDISKDPYELSKTNKFTFAFK